MVTILLRDLVARAEARKAALGIAETPGEIEAMRNKGGQRRLEKRELLRRIEERARRAGTGPAAAPW